MYWAETLPTMVRATIAMATLIIVTDFAHMSSAKYAHDPISRCIAQTQRERHAGAKQSRQGMHGHLSASLREPKRKSVAQTSLGAGEWNGHNALAKHAGMA